MSKVNVINLKYDGDKQVIMEIPILQKESNGQKISPRPKFTLQYSTFFCTSGFSRIFCSLSCWNWLLRFVQAGDNSASVSGRIPE